MNELYTHYVYSTAPHYGPKPSILHLDKLPNFGFCSLYALTEDTARAIEEAGTTARFAGSVWSERLWLDLDNRAYRQGVIDRIEELGLDHIIYDTGNRGYHIGILRDNPPSHLLPYQDKEWVSAHFPEADTSIYTHLHLFRLPGTFHAKTGQPKELYYRQAGKSLTLPRWERRDGSRSSVGGGDILTDSGNVSVFESNRIMANTIPTRNGERHPTLIKLTYALKDHGVLPNAARWYLGEVNKMAETPKTEQELYHILCSVYESKESF